MYDENTTCQQAVETWDKGDAIWSVEMGGMGPGYEQTIQVLIVELVRDNMDKPLPETDDAWSDWGDATIGRITQTCGGFSGAQVGAARSVAAKMIKMGYGKALLNMKSIDPDRLTQISNF